MKVNSLTRGLWLLAPLTAMCLSLRARAQSGVDLKGRTISIIIPNAPGGSFDLYGRLVARHIGSFLPGSPSVVAQNMPGAGGMISANWVFEKAPSDGTVMGISVPNIALANVLHVDAIRYDARKFKWVGRIVSPTATLFTWHTSRRKPSTTCKIQPSSPARGR